MLRRIGIFVYPDFQLLDATGPICVFEIAGNFADNGAYEVVVVSLAGGLVASSSGVSISSHSSAEIGWLDTLIIAGGQGSRAITQCPETLAFVRDQAKAARRICSVCSGAYPLAGAGLLDGRAAATHWRHADDLARHFPGVRVEPDAIFVQDGTIWTSAGISSGIDLALALVADDYGEAVAKQVAQEMVVYYRRPGGQSQFSALLELQSEEDRFSALLQWIRVNLTARLTYEVLAREAAMSPRNFARAFTRSVGLTPAKAVERIRLEVAREKVEHSEMPIEHIACATGFNDPERMRRAFVRAFGQPPQAMRRIAKSN